MKKSIKNSPISCGNIILKYCKKGFFKMYLACCHASWNNGYFVEKKLFKRNYKNLEALWLASSREHSTCLLADVHVGRWWVRWWSSRQQGDRSQKSEVRNQLIWWRTTVFQHLQTNNTGYFNKSLWWPTRTTKHACFSHPNQVLFCGLKIPGHNHSILTTEHF